MKGRGILRAGTTECLSIYSDNPFRDRLYGLDPSEEGVLELHRVNTREDSREGVVSGYTMGKLQKTLKPLPFRMAKLLYVLLGISATDNGTKGNRDDVNQFVSLV